MVSCWEPWAGGRLEKGLCRCDKGLGVRYPGSGGRYSHLQVSFGERGEEADWEGGRRPPGVEAGSAGRGAWPRPRRLAVRLLLRGPLDHHEAHPRHAPHTSPAAQACPELALPPTCPAGGHCAAPVSKAGAPG